MHGDNHNNSKLEIPPQGVSQGGCSQKNLRASVGGFVLSNQPKWVLQMLKFYTDKKSGKRLVILKSRKMGENYVKKLTVKIELVK